MSLKEFQPLWNEIVKNCDKPEYRELIQHGHRLESQLTHTQAMLDEAVRALEFYENGAHWTATEDTDLFIKVADRDWEKREGGWFCGGKIARETLAKIKAKAEG